MSAIHQLTLPSDGVIFPERCLDCGATTSEHHELTLKTGSLRLRLPAPMCGPCGSRRTRLRVLWHLASVAVMVAFVVVVSKLQSSGFADAHGGVMMLLLVVFSAGAVWWLFFAEARVYHRRYSRIWIASFVPGKAEEATVTLASLDDALIREIAALNGK